MALLRSCATVFLFCHFLHYIFSQDYVIKKMSAPPYSLSRLSQTIFTIVEEDHFDQRPFIYIVVGIDKLVLIDTGCNTGDLLAFLQQSLPQMAPETTNLINKILVINTHNHFDHVASNYRFSAIGSGPKSFCLGLCAGGFDKNYTLDRENSGYLMVGADQKPFTITRWLMDGERVDLGAPDNFLQVLSIPGHTWDSIALFYPRENRMFVGDFIYSKTPILAIMAGSDLAEYLQSTRKLIQFVEGLGEDVLLSCGHDDDALEWEHLQTLAMLFEGVATKKLEGKPVDMLPGSLLFESPDKSLSFAYRENGTNEIPQKGLDSI